MEKLYIIILVLVFFGLADHLYGGGEVISEENRISMEKEAVAAIYIKNGILNTFYYNDLERARMIQISKIHGWMERAGVCMVSSVVSTYFLHKRSCFILNNHFK